MTKKCYNYQLGSDFQVELKDNMIYYKKRNSFNNEFELIRAQETPNSTYGNHELKEHVLKLAEKMDLKITNAITGSAI
tara:strand:+ start:221 stop:454 length:234 start_codon:yes stop_codon:yes gene_type:complete